MCISCDLRLQDYCERLMFYDPIEYGRKADDMLWRRVFYDVIQLTKQNKNVRACPSLLSVRPLYSLISRYYSSFFLQQLKCSVAAEGAFKAHLCAATGYYHHLLFKLQSEFSLKLEGIVDVFHVPEPRNRKLLPERVHQSVALCFIVCKYF